MALTQTVEIMLQRIESVLRAIASEIRPCRACGVAIAIVRHANGHRAPYTLDGVNHFTNCPHAAQFKRPRPKPDTGQTALFDHTPRPR